MFHLLNWRKLPPSSASARADNKTAEAFADQIANRTQDAPDGYEWAQKDGQRFLRALPWWRRLGNRR